MDLYERVAKQKIRMQSNVNGQKQNYFILFITALTSYRISLGYANTIETVRTE